ncbi:MAG: Crp/Fnr family transcriptional regulator [Janthinobacterium lividum]
MPEQTFRNTLLQNLSPETIKRLKLRPVQLALRQDLEVPGQDIQHIFFVEEGIGSMTTIFRDGFEVEVSMFGYESAVGISALMGTKHSLNRVFMQLAGHGFASPLGAASEEFGRHGEFHHLALRYVQAQLTQATQSAACNAHHDHEQRFARWILICSDRAKQDVMALSQEFLADMLGSARPTVTTTARILKDKGLITYSRGTLRILDRKGLEKQACECYQVIKSHLENFADFDTGFAV